MEIIRCLSTEILHALHAVTSYTTSASHKVDDKLTGHQCTILRLALDGISLFFTGDAGTGKTKTLQKLYLQLVKLNICNLCLNGQKPLTKNVDQQKASCTP